jgi:DNA-binding GntR family transcriptional regulator
MNVSSLRIDKLLLKGIPLPGQPQNTNALSLRDAVIKNILYKIQYNEITSDEIITEAQLCEILDIGRTPVREALIELVANGVLQKVPRKGYAIRKIDSKYKTDMYEILAVLDALAATLAVPNMTETDIARMYETIDLIDIAIKYKNYENCCELQEKFHLIYIEKSDNPQLAKILDEIKSGGISCTYSSSNTEELFKVCASANDEHRHIVKLFEEKDSAQLETFLKNTHWQTEYKD